MARPEIPLYERPFPPHLSQRSVSLHEHGQQTRAASREVVGARINLNSYPVTGLGIWRNNCDRLAKRLYAIADGLEKITPYDNSYF